MFKRHRHSWTSVGVDAMGLGIESAMVISLRMMALAKGDAAAHAEAERMVMEKIDASLAVQQMAWAGSLGLMPDGASRKAMAYYRRRVRANRRRLIAS